MKFAFWICLLCLMLAATGAWAGVTGSSSPLGYADTVDWCAQAAFSCDGSNYSTPQPFVSSSGAVGLVGLPFTGQDFQALQEASSHFGGSFPDGMGLIYNGVSTLGNVPDAIAVTFLNPQWGVGAYIQTYYYGPFVAEVILLDSMGNILGGNLVYGNSTDQTSDLVWVGARDMNKDVAAAFFAAAPASGSADFEIGTMAIATPEPSSLLLMAPSMLGLYGIVRRRRSRNSQEVL